MALSQTLLNVHEFHVQALARLNQSVALYRDLVRHLWAAEDSFGLSVRFVVTCYDNI